MIEINNLDICSKVAASLAGFLKDVAKQKKIVEKSIDDFRKEALPEILQTAGENIGLPFRDKKTLEWRKYREFNVPSGWHLGIWSGETYYALSKGKDAGSTLIHKVIDNDYFEYGYSRDDGKEDYINFNIAVSKEFMDMETKNYRDRVEELIRKKIDRINAAQYNEALGYD